MLVTVELPDDLSRAVELEAERSGEDAAVVLGRWLSRLLADERLRTELVLDSVPWLQRGEATTPAPADWQPLDVPGQPLSEVIAEERGLR